MKMMMMINAELWMPDSGLPCPTSPSTGLIYFAENAEGDSSENGYPHYFLTVSIQNRLETDILTWWPDLHLPSYVSLQTTL